MGLFAGLGPRIVMTAGLVGGQFLLCEHPPSPRPSPPVLSPSSGYWLGVGADARRTQTGHARTPLGRRRASRSTSRENPLLAEEVGSGLVGAGWGGEGSVEREGRDEEEKDGRERGEEGYGERGGGKTGRGETPNGEQDEPVFYATDDAISTTTLDSLSLLVLPLARVLSFPPSSSCAKVIDPS